MRLLLLIAVLLLYPTAIVAESPDDILIIANKGVSAKSVTMDELRAMFLKKRKQWKQGGNVVPIHAKKGSPLRHQFQLRVLKMNPDEEDTYWNDQQVRHGLGPPPEFGYGLKAVFKLKGSVSYIYRKDFREGVVKVLAVVPRG